jgi:hypothetical protein
MMKDSLKWLRIQKRPKHSRRNEASPKKEGTSHQSRCCLTMWI